MLLLTVDLSTVAASHMREDHDAVEVPLIRSLPAFTDKRALVWANETDDTRHLVVDDVEVTQSGRQLRAVLDVFVDTVLFTASEERTEIHLWTWSAAAGLQPVSRDPGVHRGRCAGGTLVIVSDTPETENHAAVRRLDGHCVPIASLAE